MKSTEARGGAGRAANGQAKSKTAGPGTGTPISARIVRQVIADCRQSMAVKHQGYADPSAKSRAGRARARKARYHDVFHDGTIMSTTFRVTDMENFIAMLERAPFFFGGFVALRTVDAKRGLVVLAGSGPDVTGMPLAAERDEEADGEDACDLERNGGEAADEDREWAAAEDLFLWFRAAFRKALAPGSLSVTGMAYDGPDLVETRMTVECPSNMNVSVSIERNRKVTRLDGTISVIRSKPINISEQMLSAERSGGNVVVLDVAARRAQR